MSKCPGPIDIKESKNIFPEINKIYAEQTAKTEKTYKFIDYYEEREYQDKEHIMEIYIKEREIEKENIKLNKKYLKEIIIKLKENAT